MIRHLRIRNLATIEDLEIDFSDGFSILTGETGTGKSVIMGCIRLVLGEKGSVDLLRTGKADASVEAIFQLTVLSPDLKNFSQEGDENTFYLQRNLMESGGGRAYINGTLVPIKKIKENSEYFIDFYGQNDHIFLRQSENQLDYLDSFAQTFPLRKDVAQTAQLLRKLTTQKNELERKEQERAHQLDFLDYQIKEIEKAGLSPGEEEEIRAEREILRNAEKINSLVEEAFELAYNNDSSISALLSRLTNIISQLSIYSQEFKEIDETITQFSISIREFSDFLIKFKERHANSSEKLDSHEERLNQIEKLKRKYGPSIDDILAFLKNAKNEFEELSISEEKLAGLNKEVQETFEEYCEKSERLSRFRQVKAKELEQLIENEIGLLGMTKAKFKILINSVPPDKNLTEKIKDNGIDEIQFLISPNPGESPKPLAKIASGGELSRVMLALKSIGKQLDSMKTLIFDEIDSGIGGKTADFVAQKLKDLAKTNQVICITHLPQIASCASDHFRIDKKIEKNRTYTIVKKLEFNQRIEEIARLQAGSHITETSLKNAREMLESHCVDTKNHS
jgi:DNA repair protein RecN (Recombination protein N)